MYENQRRKGGNYILVSVVHLVLLCGAPVWAPTVHRVQGQNHTGSRKEWNQEDGRVKEEGNYNENEDEQGEPMSGHAFAEQKRHVNVKNDTACSGLD